MKDLSSPITISKHLQEDRSLDVTLRPRSFEEYMGQQKIKDNLKILISAAKRRNEAIDHLLLYGSSGLGKTSLAHIIAREAGANIKITSGPAIEKAGDLASILTSLADGDILFCDECHRLNRVIEESLYPAMEDYCLDIIIGKGPSAKTLRLDLPRFTLVGATTRIGLLSSPLRSRFGATYRLDFYEQKDIENIISRSAKLLNVQIEPAALKIIAQSARATPRVANRLLKRVRDYCQVKGNGIIDQNSTQQALSMLEIDKLGLEPTDRSLLEIMIKKFEGGPVGLQALAAAADEEQKTIEEIYEPYLLQLGFIARTPRGRLATKSAYEHLGIKYNQIKQDKLL